MTNSSASFRAELRGAAERRVAVARRRRRAAVIAVTVLAAALGGGIALAETGVFAGSPAPPNVVDEFRAYTPQLGFHPEAGRARVVARDGGDYALYATPNREGSYCVVTSAPWFQPGSEGEGGTCVPQREARQPIVAGITRMGPRDGDGVAIAVVAGRLRIAGARSVRLSVPSGEPLQRRLGESGFFVVAIPMELCPQEDWSPTVVALGADGAELASAEIPLVRVIGAPAKRETRGRECVVGGSPHGPSAGS